MSSFFRDLTKPFKTFSKRERYIFISASTIFFAATTGIILTTVYRNTVIQPAQGGSYTEGIVGQPVAINPLLIGGNEADRDLAKVLFADLLTLSDSYSTSSDGTVWIVSLKNDLVWSDNTPITTNDVVFTVETIQNPETRSPSANNWQGVSVVRLSEKEVEFTLKTPYAYFSETLKNLQIVPAHIFSAIPPANLHLSSYNLEPVGSGSYTFISYEKERTGFITSYKLQANPNYAGSRSLIETLTFKFYPSYNDAILAFNRKSIDGLGGIDARDIADLKINHRTYEIGIPRYYAIFLNQTVSSVLKEKAVREALTLATNKNHILKNILGDRGLIAHGPLAPYLPGYNDAAYERERFSAEEAVAILEENGWDLDPESNDLIRVKNIRGEKVRLSFDLIVPNIPFLVDTAALIKSDWRNIGAELTVNVVSVAEAQNSYVRTRNYEMLLFGNILRNSADLYSFWHSSQRFQPGLNLALYNNERVDALLDSARTEFDPIERNSSIAGIQQTIHDDYPAIFLFSPNYLYAAPKDLGGLDLEFISTPADRFERVQSWFLKTTRVFK
ncbi:MAG: hypothetical protein COU11_01020 [Candidatus Harrisonbacteria bacterium CG10_big_fil_rev_8_21_14_0_10_49_15]|uniref:Solute-binding protein family 5 domain-containing protein n=1 Tax=Candidatus Harrisonbacteria bacterium CG10_big_fil_rev_8_21_14_0_10_49_15 TaxID=1974587 RepID=A0A2H0ULM5_9BACT|nr:MAG: hypothetical protein COU11_01020 [Candidatus Harrisonbacteria bacterium CG10_big_fil_rev_8_21_14_0_10_49_15]